MTFIAKHVALTALLIVGACGAPAAPSPVGTGELVINWRPSAAAPGRPVSIGGYAAMIDIRSSEDVLVASFELRVTTPANRSLDAGDYSVHVRLHPASDAISIDRNGQMHRDLGPASAACEAPFRITGGQPISVLVTSMGGDSCAITEG